MEIMAEIRDAGEEATIVDNEPTESGAEQRPISRRNRSLGSSLAALDRELKEIKQPPKLQNEQKPAA